MGGRDMDMAGDGGMQACDGVGGSGWGLEGGRDVRQSWGAVVDGPENTAAISHGINSG